MTAFPNHCLRAGAAKVDISPVHGIQIAGDIGRNRPCTGIREPIYARVLALEQAGKKFAIVSVDVLAIDTPWADEIRRRVQKAYGLSPDAVMLHATQNHAAPSIGSHFCRDTCPLIPAKYPWLRGGDSRYNEPAVTGIVTAIGKAFSQLTPVTVAAGRAVDGRVAFNRRYVMRDGKARCQPPVCSPEILHVEGPTDPEVSIVTFTAGDGCVISALLHHTSHPCNGFWGNDVFPDWPGAWCDEMEAHFGPACTPVMINGCCGNIITYNYLSPDQPEQGDHRAMGRLLAESTQRALAKMTPVDTGTFRWASRIVDIPRREVPADVLAKAQKLLADHPEPIWKDPIRVEWEWVYAVGIIDIADERRTNPNFPYEIQAVRLGNVALLAIGGEPFVESQLRIKHDSPFAFTQVAHMSNGYVGYIPTRRALIGGGYETWIGRGSRLAPEAAEMVEEASLTVLRELA